MGNTKFSQIILGNKSKLTEKTFKKGELVIGENSDVKKALGVVACGRLSAKNKAGGRNVPLNEFAEGDVFGAATLFEDGVYTSEIIALEDSKIYFADEKTVTEFIEKNPEFALEYVKFLTRKIQMLNVKISGYTSKTANDKLLLYIAENGGVIHDADMSKLAKILGIGRASLYRATDELAAQKKLKKEGKELSLL